MCRAAGSADHLLGQRLLVAPARAPVPGARRLVDLLRQRRRVLGRASETTHSGVDLEVDGDLRL